MKSISYLLFAAFFLIISVTGIEAQGNDYPPEDSLCLVFTGCDHDSAMAYPNAKHVTNIIVGSYYTPAIIWETGGSWSKQSLFSYWDDLFKYWSYPDSFTSNNGEETGRGNVCSDSRGNLHFAWHQTGNPDGWEIFYTRAILDTSSGYMQFNVERPAVMISETNGIQETYPAMCLNNDNPIIVWTSGNVLYWNHSTDGGDTWIGADTAFVDIMPGDWLLPCIAPDPTSGDVWVSTSYDTNGDSIGDIVTFHYDSSNGIWEKEVAAVSPGTYEYVIPAIAVDYSGKPGIVFQRNEGWNSHVGPCGLLLFTRKVSGAWIEPETLRVAPDFQTDRTSGWPSVGITETNEIYLTFTQDSTGSGYQVFYSKIVPDQGIYNVPRGIVSVDNEDSLVGGIFPHMTYNFPITGQVAGPGIAWCTLPSGTPPADCYYKHMPLLPAGIEERKKNEIAPLMLLKVSPNPFTNSTTITFAFPSAQGHKSTGVQERDTELNIYDVSGRLVKSVPLTTNHLSLGTDLKGGIYFLKLKVKGEKVNLEMTRKIIKIE